jgi:hypothetical protein
VQVEMEDGLAATFTVIDDDSKGIAYTQLIGHFACDQQQVP